MKIVIISILSSLVFLPLGIIGQALGVFFGEYAANIFLNWFTAGFIVKFIPFIAGGYVGGYISALAVSKIYKSFNLIAAMTIPTIVIVVALLGNLLAPVFDIYNTASNITLITTYYYILREFSRSNFKHAL